MGSNFKHESSVLSKPFNVSFITGIDKDRSIILGTTPVFVIQQIPLLKSLVTLWIIIEVVKNLSVVICLITKQLFASRVQIRWQVIIKGRRESFGKGDWRKTQKEEKK